MDLSRTCREPLADLELAYETIKVNYAGYWSATKADGSRYRSGSAYDLYSAGTALARDLENFTRWSVPTIPCGMKMMQRMRSTP